MTGELWWMYALPSWAVVLCMGLAKNMTVAPVSGWRLVSSTCPFTIRSWVTVI